ncbi:FAD/NAD(P)-binding domain-containing protein [Penicillium manginii]|uniref:FAD/NAD(P)-binding domain-containing protein n=1 Tax=Penicillium manginii TaxID=203109 RepID=UPI002546A56F|nr:FAD/NAD(P)-binding domain-containing protein [Penicillium manginii]KAJ5767646.1 FAD/NAD(P)-binding domain-containing protein [Penicillium manginii]
MVGSREAERLHILIAGAGIGGLSAAIALRQAGHVVDVFESSRFAVELGAAIHLPPNVNGLLRRIGVQPDDFQCNDAEFVSVFDSQGNLISSKDVRNLREIYPFPWQLAHRIDLHDALKDKATSLKGTGVPVKIHLRSKVVDCHPASPSLTLIDGTEVKGDLLIGADGVHSSLRTKIAREDIAAEPSGGSAFRFLVPMSKVKANPVTASLVQKAGELQFWDGQYRRLVIYPCRVFDEFSTPMKSLLAMADPDSIKLWRLLDRKALGTWINGNSCLIGDAAHPFLPHQGQGGAQAIEDGIALGALFPLGTPRAEIPERLELYMECRYDRATMIQNFSRQAAFKISAKDDVGALEFMRTNFGHDACDFAANVLRKHMVSRIPKDDTLSTAFGLAGPFVLGFLGPDGILGSPSQRSLEIEFRARRNYLETFLPTVKSRITSPGGWAKASWITRRLQSTEWKGESEVTLVGLNIPNALLSHDGEGSGNFTPIVFCENAEFVISAREELSLPILLADITESIMGSGYRISVGASVFPGLANVIMRLQGLDIKSPVITHSDTQIN